MSLEQAMQLAMQHHRAGSLGEADILYREVLQEKPDHPEALHLRGVLASQTGKHEIAVDLIRRAIAGNPDSPDYYTNLGIALCELGRLDESVTAFRQSLTLRPSDPQTLTSFANALRKRGEAREAIAACRRALAVRPDSPEAHNNLGNAYQLTGALDDAAAEFRQAIALQPRNAEAYGNFGAVMLQKGLPNDAISACRQAIQLRPDFADAYCNLGLAFLHAGDFDSSIQALRQAIALRPNFVEARYNLAEALAKQGNAAAAVECYVQTLADRPRMPQLHNNLGNAFRALGNLDQAVASFSQAVALDPLCAAAWNNLGSALAEKCHLDPAVASTRRALAINPDCPDALANLGGQLFALGEIDQALAAHDRALKIAPNAAIASNRLFIMQYQAGCDPKALLREHRQWNDQYARPLQDSIRPHDIDRDPIRPLRIGYVSPDLRNHVVGWNLLPLLSSHDREKFEIFCYSSVACPDAHTEKLKAAAGVWRDISRLDDKRAAELIRADRIDILVDLSLHMAGNRLLLFTRKPAPVQVSYLGYAGGAGIDAIDFRFSDPHLDPAAADLAHYAEQTIRLPRTYWCYHPGGDAPEVDSPPALTNRYVTFGCLANFAKVSGPALDAFAAVLNRVPRSRLLLNCPAGHSRQRVQKQFASHGITVDRLEFVDRRNWSSYIQTYAKIDIALDPFPYSGGITTCDALWMGVPVVSLSGQLAVHRGGRTVLSNVGLPQLIANTPEEYINLAADCERWIPLRPTLRPRMLASPLMNPKEFARDVEAAYTKMWKSIG